MPIAKFLKTWQGDIPCKVNFMAQIPVIVDQSCVLLSRIPPGTICVTRDWAVTNKNQAVFSVTVTWQGHRSNSIQRYDMFYGRLCAPIFTLVNYPTLSQHRSLRHRFWVQKVQNMDYRGSDETEFAGFTSEFSTSCSINVALKSSYNFFFNLKSSISILCESSENDDNILSKLWCWERSRSLFLTHS